MEALFNVVWSQTAESTYLETLNFIIESWSLKEAQAFDEKVERLIQRLSKHKHLCPSSSSNPQIRRCVISKQTSLTYKVSGQTIKILFFFDNRSNLKF